MQAPKTLRRPANWQDFETLCKKLWGEIWECKEIKKNGRLGQNQNGVDVYGIPNGENMYYGIQCKGKDEYSHKNLSEKEIVDEIEKAKKFSPPIKKLYFAATASKDSKIEEFVRKVNILNTENNLFEIHLFCWEDIVDLIDENKDTHNWYVHNQNYKTFEDVEVTFENGSLKLIATPKYIKTTIINTQKIISSNQFNFLNLYTIPNTSYDLGLATKYNLSFAKIEFKIKNTGLATLENFKLFIELNGQNIKKITNSNIAGGLNFHIISSDVIISDELYFATVIPTEKILVSDDYYISSPLFIETNNEKDEIIVKWKLISKSQKKEGELRIFIDPIVIEKTIENLVEDPLEVGIKVGNVEHYLSSSDY